MESPQITNEAPMDVTTSSSTDPSLATLTHPTLGADPASSLRAAALLTLKTKRRKIAPVSHAGNPTQTTRPPPPDNQMQLDYGQEDAVPASEAAFDSVKKPLSVTVPLAEDGQAREEGEISDEETQSPLPSGSIKPKVSNTQVQYPRVKSPTLDVKMVKPQPSTPPRQASQTETPLANIPRNWSSNDPDYSLSTTATTQLDKLLSIVDGDHVRPGLTMNQPQYDLAKDIILDLLGWGVTPEHLVEYGLSREIIYYAFNELNLRLPENLVTADLMPYPPYPEMLSYAPPHLSSEPTPLQFHRDVPTSFRNRSSSPQEFIAPVLSAASSGQPSSSSSMDNLHDIERQRRQELLARKAAQASRKARQSKTLQDSQPEIKASKDSVDDFLKAITSTSLSRQNSLEMNVDETPHDSVDPTTMPIDPLEDNSSGGSLASTPLSPHHANAAASSATSDSTVADDIRILRQTVENSVSQRRGQKRPVASDFVDFDAVPRNSLIGTKQRKIRGGFAGHSAMRRFVIDISDSEADDDENYNCEPSDGQLDLKRARTHLPPHSDPQSAAAPNARRDTQAPPSLRVTSPASLVQKELEIQRMRELIAKREQKLAAAKSSSKVESNGTSAPSPIREISMESLEFADMSPADISHEQPIVPEEPSPTEATPGASLTDKQSSKAIVEDEHSQLIHSSSNTTTQPISQPDEPVDVDMAPSSSTQVSTTPSVLPKPDEKQDPSTDSSMDTLKFADYDSPFQLYPTLRMRSMASGHSSNYATSDFSSTDISASSSLPSLVSSNSIPFLDLNLLKLSAIARQLDPAKQICQYEIPGGGECRDSGCTDVHLSRVGLGPGKSGGEPSDDDIADFLADTLPSSWLAEYDVTRAKILNSLEQVRIKKPNVLIEGRVKEALSALGPLSVAT